MHDPADTGGEENRDPGTDAGPGGGRGWTPVDPGAGPGLHPAGTVFGAHHPIGMSLRDRAVHAMMSGIVIVDLTLPDQPIVDANPAFCRITQYPYEEVIGRNCRFLQGAGTDPAVVRRIREAIDGRAELTVTLLNYRLDGEPFWNELHLAPVRIDDQPITHFVGYQLDVTERERDRSHGRFLAEATTILGATLDFDTTLVDLARLAVPRVADWCGVDLVAEDARVKRTVSVRAGGSGAIELDEVVDVPSVAETDLDIPATVIRTGVAALVADIAAVDESSSPFLRERAREGMTSVLVAPLTARGRTFGALSLAVSQPARRYVEADLTMAISLASRTAMAIDNARLFADQQSAVRARDQFLSIAAHELRTPISSIKGYAQLLQRAHARMILTPERFERSIGTIVLASERLALLTDDLLDVSRLQMDHMPLRTRRIDYGQLLTTIMEHYSDAFQDRHAIVLAPIDDACEVKADPERIEQVIINLLENAAKYSPEGGDILVRIWATGERMYTEVRDNGIGMTAEGLRGAFEPFVRSSEAVERGIPGLGLGLYICRGIIARHGGGIHAESEPGAGVSVTFWLPCEG